MLKSKSALNDAQFLGGAVENAVFKHLYARLYRQPVGFSYWRGKKNLEVDLIAYVGGNHVPFEIKYRRQHTGLADLQGLLAFCQQRNCSRCYVVTRAPEDFGVLEPQNVDTKLLKIPAPLLCYWMGQAELTDAEQSLAGAEIEDYFG